MSEITPEKISAYIPVSQEMLKDAEDLAAAWERWNNATPEERQEWADLAAAQRKIVREHALRVYLTMDILRDRMGWTEQYVEHLVQLYCECGPDSDGWYYCEHAKDLGLDS